MIELAYDVGEYHRVLSRAVADGDTVLEIGPHVGRSTLSYLRRAGRVVVVDKASQSRDTFKVLQKKNENLYFVNGDVRSFSTIKKTLKILGSCDVLAVDMGGGRYPDTVFKVWATWSGIFRPRDSIIRSRGLIEFVRRAKAEDSSLPREYEESGWLSYYGRKTPYALKKQLDEFGFYVNINQPLG